MHRTGVPIVADPASRRKKRGVRLPPTGSLYFSHHSTYGNTRLPRNASFLSKISSLPQREMYFFALYRLLAALLIVALVFSPVLMLGGIPRNPPLATVVSIGYLLAAMAILVWGRRTRWPKPTVLIGIAMDIVAATLIAHALPDASAGISMVLLFNLATAAMLLPFRYGMNAAAVASLALIFEYLWTLFEGHEASRSLAELLMFSSSYLALTFMAYQIGHRARRSQALAEQRSAEVASLVEINELIIRRMRIGVLVVDAENNITLVNEAASLLLGDSEDTQKLNTLAPELARRLLRWRGGWQGEESPLLLRPDQAEVQPRFARLLADTDLTLVFLDDATVVSRRAESLTLAAMGRFSASLAHEIRNPLAAISYASQLLEESEDIGIADRRLLQIINQQCQRTNGIVESVLGLARRERANPENLDLGNFVTHIVEDYRQTLPLETDSIEANPPAQPVSALVDPKHLQQVITALIHNALKYGRMPDEPARVRLRVFQQENTPCIDVIDRGPGIPESVAAQLFRPFFTTSEHGTGLGLYIARELCRANQAKLEYVMLPGGGACFRITLPGTHNMLPA